MTGFLTGLPSRVRNLLRVRPPAEAYRWFGARNGRGTVVVLVHGLLGSMDTSWGRIPELLKKLPDIDVLLVAFPTGVLRRAPTVERLGAHLSTDIRLLCDGYERIVLVGHSLGCLVIQSAIVQELLHGRADAEVVGRITDVVLYAPPFEGKQWLTVLEKFDVPASRQLKSMAAGSDALSQLRAEWVN